MIRPGINIAVAAGRYRRFRDEMMMRTLKIPQRRPRSEMVAGHHQDFSMAP
jgi:hypothetical protein